LPEGFTDIIAQLERQKTAIAQALAALKELGGPTLDSPAPAPAPVTAKTGTKRKAKRKGGITPEGRARLSEAMRARWAAKNAPASKKRGA
jgi:hypothetical protein